MSDDRQIKGYSLDSQEEICKKEAERQGFEVSRVFREEGVSARTLDRPQLADLLRFVKNKINNIQAVFVYHSSRLSRNALDFLTLKGMFAKNGISLISTSEPIDGNSPEHNFLATMMSAVNQLENDTRIRNISNSMRKRFLDGHITSKPPLGYLMQRVNGKSVAAPDPKWFNILKAIWQRIPQERLSFQQIARELNKFKLREKHFNKAGTSKLFTNKFYMGILASQKYGEAQGKHEPMISKQLFYQCQALFHTRAIKTRTKVQLREDFALRGILKCSVCGRRLTSAWSTGKLKKYPYYLCYKREENHPLKNYPRDEIEESYLSLLHNNIQVSEKRLVYFTEILKELYVGECQQLSESRDAIEKELDGLKKAKKRIRDKHKEGVYTDEDYIEMRDEVDIQIAEKQSLLSEKKIDMLDIDALIDFIKYYLANLDAIFVKSPPEGRLAIGCSIFPDGLVYDDGKFRTPTIGRAYKLIGKFTREGSDWVIRQGLEP